MQNPNKRSFTPTPKILVWGFTLIELLMVIGIIIILAGIAIPNFAKAKERVLTKEAIANLKLIAAAEKVWRIDSTNNTYTLCNCSTDAICNALGGCNYLLKLNLTTQNWTYVVGNVTPGPPPTFTATADRVSGPYSTCIYTITESGDPVPSGTCP